MHQVIPLVIGVLFSSSLFAANCEQLEIVKLEKIRYVVYDCVKHFKLQNQRSPKQIYTSEQLNMGGFYLIEIEGSDYEIYLGSDPQEKEIEIKKVPPSCTDAQVVRLDSLIYEVQKCDVFLFTNQEGYTTTSEIDENGDHLVELEEIDYQVELEEGVIQVNEITPLTKNENDEESLISPR